MIYRPDAFILTGGPGAGKSTVLDALHKAGHSCIPEAARQIIREQEAAGGHAVPWKDMMAYTRLMYERSLADYHAAAARHAGICFFDRGIADVIGHARLNGLALDAEIYTAAQQCRYNKQVFLFPPWEAIYHTDTERKQSYAEAVSTCRVIREVYVEYGYTLTEVPLTTVEGRVAFILDAISQPPSSR